MEVEAKDQDETSAAQGCRLGNAKGPSLLVRTQVISKVDWPASHSRGAREWSIQVRNPGGGSHSLNLEYGKPQVLFQLRHFVLMLFLYEQCDD